MCHVCATVCCLILFVCVTGTASQEFCGSYTERVKCGWWWWRRCDKIVCNKLGKYTCTCPGTGQSVEYSIDCQGSDGRCRALYSGKNCDKFTNCATCLGFTNEFAGGCASCKAGYQLSSGFCKEDINECASNSLNTCQQICTNTIGSYVCSCNLGYTLQPGGACAPINCGQPENITNGSLNASGSYVFSSYVQYSCNYGLLLNGNTARQCLVGPWNIGYWNGSSPSCIDTCNLVGSVQRQQCGSPTVTLTECMQLGCCHSLTKGQPSCYYRQGMLSTTHSEERPTLTARLALNEFSVDACGLNCSLTSWCRAFAIQQRPFDQITHQTCYLYDQSRSRMAMLNWLSFSNTTFELHEPLVYGVQQPDDPDNLNMTYVGCYDVASSENYYRVWSSQNNNPSRCVAACRQQGFRVAELQNGADCFCRSEYDVKYVNINSSKCVIPCTGRPDLICGGPASSSVYRVPPDTKYIGCYKDVANLPDLDTLLWSLADGSSASLCISDCRRSGYMYAGVQNGTTCYCSNTFGRYDQLSYDQCRGRCTETPGEDCGGPLANAVYATAVGLPMSSEMQQGVTYRNIYSTNNRTVEIPLLLFTVNPRLTAITTPRLVIHVTGTVGTPAQHSDCRSVNCYTTCGDISPYDTQGLQYKGSDQTVRFFFLNMSQLMSFVGVDAQRVYVYAQTVLIDADLTFPFSLLIYARELLIDRRTASKIRVSSSTPVLGLDFNDREKFGVQIDSMFMKQSYMCARIMMDSGRQADINTGWAILDDLARSDASGAEQSAWLSAVVMFKSHLAGIRRQNIHFVPFYSKSFFSSVLQQYYNRITVYKTDFDALLEGASSQRSYLQIVKNLLGAYDSTSVSDAQTAYDASLMVLTSSNTSIYQLKNHIDAATAHVDSVGESFIKRTKRAISAAKVVEKLISFIAKIWRWRDAPIEANNQKLQAEAIQHEAEAVFGRQLGDLAVSLFDVESTVSQLMQFLGVSDEILSNLLSQNYSSYDYTKYAGDIESVTQLKAVVVQWQNLARNVETIFIQPTVSSRPGCTEYLKAVLELSNWGAALTNAAISHAELLRDAIQKSYTLISKRQQTIRYNYYVANLTAGVIAQQQMTAAMAEQVQDIRIDLNDKLVCFCQAYHYENLETCPSKIQPAFGGSLSELLRKISNAMSDALLVSKAPSTVNRQVIISSNDSCPSCLIQDFRDNGYLEYSLDIENPAFSDLYMYRVGTIFLDFIGATQNITSKNSQLKVLIASNGIFRDKKHGKVYDFVTSPLSLAYEYDVKTGDISICADVSKTYRNTVHHVTPFTTWMFALSSRSLDIDLSQLTEIRIRFLGSAVNAEAGPFAMGTIWNPCS